MRNLFYIITLLYISSCSGFYAPYTMELDVPDGPPAFQAGWKDGCESGLSVKRHANAWVYKANFGNGLYQHDPLYQSTWAMAYYNCYNASSTATRLHPFREAPLMGLSK